MGDQQDLSITVEALRAENAALTTALRDVLRAMRMWGSYGIQSPDARISAAYDRAKALLDAKDGG